MRVFKDIFDALARTQLAKMVLRGFGKEPRPCAEGHIIYHKTKKCLELWDGSKWVEIPGPGGVAGSDPLRWTMFLNDRLKNYDPIDAITGAKTPQMIFALDPSGYTDCVIGDVGLPVTINGNTVGNLISYDNINHLWAVVATEFPQVGDAIAVDPGSGGIGAGTELLAGNQDGNYIRVAGDQTAKYPVGQTVHVCGSTANDGVYIVRTVGFTSGSTTIELRCLASTGDLPITDETTDGVIYGNYGAWNLIWACAGGSIVPQTLTNGGLRFIVQPSYVAEPLRDISLSAYVSFTVETVIRMGSDPQVGDSWEIRLVGDKGVGSNWTRPFYMGFDGTGSVSMALVGPTAPGIIALSPGSLYTLRYEVCYDGGDINYHCRGSIWIDGILVYDSNWISMLNAAAPVPKLLKVYYFDFARDTDAEESDTFDLLRATIAVGLLDPLTPINRTEPIPTEVGV